MDLGIGGLGHATEIGAGASAVVYRARQLSLDREVAVKVLSATDEAFVRRFHREAMTLGKLSLNPGIVTVHGTGVTESGHPYLILELCESSVLDHLKTEGRFEPMDACRVGAQVADAVSDAHSNGVIHRDIKPGNLLRSQNGRYLITDFGIATVRGSTLGQTDSIGFTAGYVAPETLRGEEAGTPSDVYALGATLFHMLSGHPPFVDQSGNSNLLALAQRVINDPVPDLRPYGVPDDVCRIVEAAMAKHPQDRPTAAQLRDQLQAVVNGGATINVRPAPADPTFQQPASQQTAALSATDIGGLAPPSPAAGQAGFTQSDPAPVPVGGVPPAPSTGLPVPPPVNGGYAGQADQTAVHQDAQVPHPGTVHAGAAGVGGGGAVGGGGLLGDQGAAVPPGHVNYPLPPHSDDGPPWTLILLGALATIVLVLAGVAVLLNLSGNDDGVAATDTEPDSPTTNEDASEGGAGGSDSGGVANSLPENSSTTVVEADVAAVPDLTGFTEAAARAALIDDGFEVLVQERNSTVAAAGTVVAQEPAAGTEETVGSVVVIFIAVEPEVETVTVPALAGLTEAAATAALADLGLTVGVPIREFNDEVADGNVIRSAPDSGTAVEPDSEVVLVISQGVAPPTCAELVDLSETAATARIEAAGLTAQVQRQESEAEPEGEVLSCEVNETTISLVVSDGPDICGVVTGMQLAAGTAALEDRGYTVTAEAVVRPALPAGEIITCTKQDTTATITYAAGLPTECPTGVIGATAAAARTLLEEAGFSNITAELEANDTAPDGEVFACDVAGEAVTIKVSTGPAVKTGRLTVTFGDLEVEGDCAGEGLQPDLYGNIGIEYRGDQEAVWDNRGRLQALTPNASGVLDLDETVTWNNVETGGDLTIGWNIRDVDRILQPGDEDNTDDDVSMVVRTIQLTDADRAWRPPSDNNDPCTIRINLAIAWTNLSDQP
ncbi:MAG: PASTA domain-containing protein [Actinomycetota bacterium]